LNYYLKDNTNAWEMTSDSTFHKVPKRGAEFTAQETLMQLYGSQDISKEASAKTK